MPGQLTIGNMLSSRAASSDSAMNQDLAGNRMREEEKVGCMLIPCPWADGGNGLA